MVKRFHHCHTQNPSIVLLPPRQQYNARRGHLLAIRTSFFYTFPPDNLIHCHTRIIYDHPANFSPLYDSKVRLLNGPTHRPKSTSKIPQKLSLLPLIVSSQLSPTCTTILSRIFISPTKIRIAAAIHLRKCHNADG